MYPFFIFQGERNQNSPVLQNIGRGLKTPWYHLNFGINANTLVTFNGVNRKLLLCFSQNLLRSEGQKRIPDAAYSQGGTL